MGNLLAPINITSTAQLDPECARQFCPPLTLLISDTLSWQLRHQSPYISNGESLPKLFIGEDIHDYAIALGDTVT